MAALRAEFTQLPNPHINFFTTFAQTVRLSQPKIIDCILVFIVYYFLFFFSITR